MQQNQKRVNLLGQQHQDLVTHGKIHMDSLKKNLVLDYGLHIQI